MSTEVELSTADTITDLRARLAAAESTVALWRDAGTALLHGHPSDEEEAQVAMVRLLRDPAAGAGELARLRRELAAALADYAMLRAVARMCFQEDASEDSMLRLWNIAAMVDHPGAPLNIRFNRALAVVAAARTHDNGTIDDALFAYDAPLKEKSNDDTTTT
jgi:hypothetical protein